MSTKFNVASDPNGSLAWPLSLLVLLLQRLRFQVGLEQGQIEDWRTSQIADDEELDAVRDLADKFRLLSEADELSLSDIFLGDNVPVRSGLRENFLNFDGSRKFFISVVRKIELQCNREGLDQT